MAPFRRGRVSDPGKAALSGSQSKAPGSAAGYTHCDLGLLLSELCVTIGVEAIGAGNSRGVS